MLPANRYEALCKVGMFEDTNRLCLRFDRHIPRGKGMIFLVLSDETPIPGDIIECMGEIGMYQYDSISKTHDLVEITCRDVPRRYPYMSNEYFHKIVACSDSYSTFVNTPEDNPLSLSIPTLPNHFYIAFIYRYNEKNPLKEIMVRYDGNRVERDSNGAVYIREVKDTFSRDEVQDIAKDLLHQIKESGVMSQAELEAWFNKYLENSNKYLKAYKP